MTDKIQKEKNIPIRHRGIKKQGNHPPELEIEQKCKVGSQAGGEGCDFWDWTQMVV